jgi:SOS response regulatory protein OraA/RecX
MATKVEVQEFISKLSKLAIAERNKRDKWVLPSICIAQSALETGWGKSKLMVKANAYFGIKAGKSWKGKVYSSKTQECYDGVNYTTITDTFRAYDSVEQSVSDYFDLITGSSRYVGAVNNGDALSTITAIKNGGYATSPTYIQNVMSIVKQYNLEQYDTVTKKSNEEIAKEVINGKWGNGAIRKQKLSEAGYDFSVIQKLVNKLLSNNTKDEVAVTAHKKTNEEIAKEVINGKWGNGETRKKKLTEAGYDYSVIQKLVNKLLA